MILMSLRYVFERMLLTRLKNQNCHCKKEKKKEKDLHCYWTLSRPLTRFGIQALTTNWKQCFRDSIINYWNSIYKIDFSELELIWSIRLWERLKLDYLTGVFLVQSYYLISRHSQSNDTLISKFAVDTTILWLWLMMP